MSFDFSYLVDLLPRVLEGLLVTIQVSVLAVTGGVIAGLLLASLRSLGFAPLTWIQVAFVEVIRNTPFLAQLFLLYFGLPTLGISMPDFFAGALALGIWTSAYASENFRAGLEAPSKQVREAGHSLALTSPQVFLLIVLPLGIRTAFPSLVNTIIEATKHSAYLSLIAFPELTYVVVNDVASSFRAAEGFALLLAGYLVLVLGLVQLLRIVERRLAITRTV